MIPRRPDLQKRGRTLAFVVVVILLLGVISPGTGLATDSSWNVVPSANTSPDEHNRLFDIDCVGQDDCWAVGFSTGCTEVSTEVPLPVSGVGICNQHKTLIEHWDGTAWTIVESPNPSPHANQLWGVECVGAADCWAVGNYTGAGGAWSLILHWDGSRWEIVPTPNPTSPLLDGKLRGITCVSPSDCWAVGHGSNYITSDTIPRENPLVLHWNGLVWSIVASPNPNVDQSHELRSVTCVGPEDCWAVGHSLTRQQRHFTTLVMHWDGLDWALVDSPNPNEPTKTLTGNTLTGVTCTSSSDCWAVGASPPRGTLMLRWNGETWEPETTPPGNTLNGVTCVSESECWAVGGAIPFLGVQILAWDGASWKTVRSPGGGMVLDGVSCVDDGTCWAAGSEMPGPAGPRASTFQTLTVGTIAVDIGDGKHSREPAPDGMRWVSRYDGPAGRLDAPKEIAVSPDGATIFVTGESRGADRREDFATVAYDSATGEPLWLARYDGTGGVDEANALSVAPDGTRVFVTGQSQGDSSDNDIATVAYDAADGRLLWAARYDGPANADDTGSDVKLSPDGSRVFVTGGSQGIGTGTDFTTITYDAADGREMWVARYDGPKSATDSARAVGIAPDGSRIYVGGYSAGVDTGHFDYATIAYDALSGSALWTTRYNGRANGYDVAHDLIASEDGSRVFVTGESNGGTDPVAFDGRDFATVAYEGATGRQLWAAVFNGPEDNHDLPQALGLSPDGNTLFVTGSSNRTDLAGTVTDRDATTVAYDSSDGSELWSDLFNGIDGGQDHARALGVAPDGKRVYVSAQSDGEGSAYDMVVLGYDAIAGSVESTTRYNGTGNGDDIPLDVHVSPDNSRVYATGFSQPEDRGLPGHEDFVTIASDTGDAPSETPSLKFTARSATSGQYSDKVLFEARLTAPGGEPIAGAPLTFTLGAAPGREFTATTDENGLASVTPTLTEKPGPHDLTVRYAGDGSYPAAGQATTFEVTREDTDLELNVEGKGNDMTFKARLSDRDTTAVGVSGRTVEFYSDAELVGTAVTDAQGVATLPVPPGHRGANRSYEVLFPGDDFYIGSSDERPGQGGAEGDGAPDNSEWVHERRRFLK